MDGRGKQKPLETHRIKTVGESNIIDKPGTSPNDRTPTPQSRDCYCVNTEGNLGLCSDGCTNAGEGCADDTWCFGQGEVSEVDILQRMYVGVPEFEMSYKLDSRQSIADSWPQSIDDHFARTHWEWKHQFDLNEITEDMIANLRKEYN